MKPLSKCRASLCCRYYTAAVLLNAVGADPQQPLSNFPNMIGTVSQQQHRGANRFIRPGFARPQARYKRRIARPQFVLQRLPLCVIHYAGRPAARPVGSWRLAALISREKLNQKENMATVTRNRRLFGRSCRGCENDLPVASFLFPRGCNKLYVAAVELPIDVSADRFP